MNCQRFPHSNDIFVFGQVTDCGLIVDIDQTPACKLVEDKFDVKADFPDCCPVFDCEEGAQIVYKKKGGKE